MHAYGKRSVTRPCQAFVAVIRTLAQSGGSDGLLCLEESGCHISRHHQGRSRITGGHAASYVICGTEAPEGDREVSRARCVTTKMEKPCDVFFSNLQTIITKIVIYRCSVLNFRFALMYFF